MAESANHVVDSIYLLRFPNEIIDSFNSTPESIDCVIIYENTHFKVHCPREKSEQVLRVFYDIYNEYIETELSTGPADSFELPKIQKLEGTIISDDPTTVYETISSSSNRVNGIMDTSGFAECLILHESVVREYESLSAECFTTEVVREIEKVTNCTLNVNEGTGKINVRGDSTEEVDKALTKLAIIDDSYLQRISRTESFDIYVPEKEFNFRFRFLTPERVIDRRILFEIRDFLSRYLEVNMVKWHSDGQQWLRIPVQSASIQVVQDVPHPWFDYVYPQIGSQFAEDLSIENNSMRTHSFLAPSQVSKLAAWTEKIPLNPEDPFHVAFPGNEKVATVTAPLETPNIGYEKRKRVVRGQNQTIPTQTEQSCSVAPDPGTELPPISEPFMPAEVDVATEDHVNNTAVVLVEPAPDTYAPAYRERGDLIDHPELIAFASPVVEPVQRISAWPNAEALIYQRDDEIEQEHQVLRKLNLSQMVLQPGPEKVQLKSEVSSRRYRRTTNLKASKTESVNTKGITITERIIGPISSVLELARTSYGRVTFEIAVGHIYVGRSEQNTNLVIEQSEWSSAFKTRHGADQVSTFFSSAVTTSSVDANFIADLRLPSSIDMFIRPPAEKMVTYVMKCVNRYNKREMILEIDQDGKHEIYEAPQSLGSVNCHFPKRIWDASFRMTESIPANLDPRDPVKTIANSLWTQSGALAVLRWKKPGPEVAVTSVLVRRQTSYTCSNNRDLLLRLTEVQDLVLLQHPDQPIHQAFAASDEEMIRDDNRIWWEASITSKAMDKVLEENQTLEFGSIANWTLDDVVGKFIVNDMFHLAEQVVTRIDDVGCESNAVLYPLPPSTARSRATKSSRTSKDKKFVDTWSQW